MTSPTAGIVGVGAIGGSIGLRARRNGTRVLGSDISESALTRALEAGAIDARATVEELAESADALILAAHLTATISEIELLRRSPGSRASLIVDVASVKVPVAEAARGLRNFVATHPMAGTERSGVSAARPDLFEGRTWAYVPSHHGDLDGRACAFIESMGGMPFAIGAEEHDRAVALSSHLPQLVAWCYAELMRSSDTAAAQVCGPVARELLRISSMSFDIWRDVLQANARNLEQPLRSISGALEQLANALAKDDMERVYSLFGSISAAERAEFGPAR